MDIFSSGKFCSIIFGVIFHLLFTLFSLSLVNISPVGLTLYFSYIFSCNFHLCVLLLFSLKLHGLYLSTLPVNL